MSASEDAPGKVSVFDTTLRDGEQTPGVSFTPEQKITIAQTLSEMGVHAIEAGFPASSEDEAESVRAIASLNLDSVVCGLSRALKSDVDTCIGCGVDMIHIFIPTSEVQRTHTIRKSHEEVLSITSEVVGYAHDHCDSVLFSAMDATRTPLGDLIEVYKAAAEAGASVINVPDTVGIATPASMKALITEIRGAVDCQIDVHCHNDFGMAVANTISAVEAGASQVQVTVNGMGERAGNADLAQTVMVLEAICGISTGIVTNRLVSLSRTVSRFSGIAVPPIQPVTGDNAFSHESGIHAHGVIAETSTFEPGIMTPAMVGHRRKLRLGKHAGRHAVAQILSDAHITPDSDELDEILVRVKEISGRGRKVTEYDLYEIAETVTGRVHERAVVLEGISVVTGSNAMPTASVMAEVKGKSRVYCSVGNGPVDAAMKAVLGATGMPVQLREFEVAAISGGTDAIGHVTITVEDDLGQTFNAGASGDDIIIASVEAMINALNLMYMAETGGEGEED